MSTYHKANDDVYRTLNGSNCQINQPGTGASKRRTVKTDDNRPLNGAFLVFSIDTGFGGIGGDVIRKTLAH